MPKARGGVPAPNARNARPLPKPQGAQAAGGGARIPAPNFASAPSDAASWGQGPTGSTGAGQPQPKPTPAPANQNASHTQNQNAYADPSAFGFGFCTGVA